jgi:hypothetical protein
MTTQHRTSFIPMILDEAKSAVVRRTGAVVGKISFDSNNDDDRIVGVDYVPYHGTPTMSAVVVVDKAFDRDIVVLARQLGHVGTR